MPRPKKLKSSAGAHDKQLVVLWTRNAHLRTKEFPFGKPEKAFNWYWKLNASQIVVYQNGLPQYPSFSESNLPEWVQKRPRKELWRKYFLKWFGENFGGD